MKAPYWICLDNSLQLDELRQLVTIKLMMSDPTDVRYQTLKELDEKLKAF